MGDKYTCPQTPSGLPTTLYINHTKYDSSSNSHKVVLWAIFAVNMCPNLIHVFYWTRSTTRRRRLTACRPEIRHLKIDGVIWLVSLSVMGAHLCIEFATAVLSRFMSTLTFQTLQFGWLTAMPSQCVIRGQEILIGADLNNVCHNLLIFCVKLPFSGSTNTIWLNMISPKHKIRKSHNWGTSTRWLYSPRSRDSSYN